jgi:predicted regulator of Ras-like GTPase activity (Roadblock/LC7/MglB family)
MADTKKDRLGKILQGLRKIGDVVGSAVISVDGLPIASDFGEGIDEETFAAMSAAMHGAAETAVSELKQGSLKQIIIDADKGKMMTIAAGEKAILVILTKPDINLGLALLELGRASGKISDVLGDA